MKRYPAYEFPEYAQWSPDPEAQKAFADTMSADPERAEFIDSLSVDELLKLYESLVTARLHDIHLKRWVRQGVITKAWLGEEAITVGACAAPVMTTSSVP